MTMWDTNVLALLRKGNFCCAKCLKNDGILGVEKINHNPLLNGMTLPFDKKKIMNKMAQNGKFLEFSCWLIIYSWIRSLFLRLYKVSFRSGKT